MAVKTFYGLDAVAVTPNWYSILQDGGAAPAASQCGYGYQTKGLATPFYFQSHLGAAAGSVSGQAGSYIAALTAPTKGTGATNATAGDSFVSPMPYTGTFPAGNWTLAFGFINSSTTACSGNIRCRVWASTNASGVGARQLSTGVLTGSTISISNAGPTQSSITWAAPAITMANEYLFFQVEWLTSGTPGAATTIIFYYASKVVFTTTNLATNVSTTATGLAATAGLGGVVVDTVQAASTNLTGQQVAASVGAATVTTTRSDTVTLIGPVATAFAGSVAVVANRSDTVALAGQGLAASVGAVSVVEGSGVAVNVTGQAVTASIGNVAVTANRAVSVNATGQAITAAAGGVAVSIGAGGNISVAVTGLAMAAALGNRTVTTGAVVNLTGQQAAASVGNETALTITYANVTGQTMFAAAGFAQVQVAATAALTGLVMTASRGNVVGSASIDVAVGGLGMTALLNSSLSFVLDHRSVVGLPQMLASVGTVTPLNWGAQLPGRREDWTNVTADGGDVWTPPAASAVEAWTKNSRGSGGWTPVAKDTPNDWT